MTNEEKNEFFQEMRNQIDVSVNLAVDKAVKEAVDRTVNKAVKEAVDETVDKAMNKAVNKSVNEAVDRAVNKAMGETLDERMNQAIEKAITPLRTDISELKDKIVPNMQEDIKNISRSVAVIEVEHGKKLDILFDAFSMNLDNIKKCESRIATCEKKIDKQEGEIYYLKSNIKKI